MVKISKRKKCPQCKCCMKLKHGDIETSLYGWFYDVDYYSCTHCNYHEIIDIEKYLPGLFD